MSKFCELIMKNMILKLSFTKILSLLLTFKRLSTFPETLPFQNDSLTKPNSYNFPDTPPTYQHKNSTCTF